MTHSDTNCTKYNEQVLPNEQGNCSLCGAELASIQERLEYIRAEIVADRVSYGEIAELQSLTEYIDPGDVLLLEWAGVPEDNHIIKQPVHRDGTYYCPDCMTELAGDGENYIECMECDYKIHELDIVE